MLEVLIKNQKKTKKLDKLSSANLDRLVRSKARSEICSVVLKNLIWKEEMKEIHITIILVLKNKCWLVRKKQKVERVLLTRVKIEKLGDSREFLRENLNRFLKIHLSSLFLNPLQMRHLKKFIRKICTQVKIVKEKRDLTQFHSLNSRITTIC